MERRAPSNGGEIEHRHPAIPGRSATTTWWAPVWRGLVVDPAGKHVRRLKGALALLLYLILHADRQSGLLVRKYETIGRDMGHSLWTVRGWMRRLERHGYVRRTKTGRALVIEVLNWRPVGHASAPLRGLSMPIRQARTHHLRNSERPGSQQRRGQSEGRPVPNESKLKRVIQRNNNGVKNFSGSDNEPKRSQEEWWARAEILARDLAAGLGDREHLSHYRTYARRFPESLLRRLLSEARATPERAIKRSKAALFEYLLKQHVLSTKSPEPHHSRD